MIGKRTQLRSPSPGTACPDQLPSLTGQGKPANKYLAGYVPKPTPYTGKGLPLLFEDEGLEMGESSLHTQTSGILFYGLKFHLVGRPSCRVFQNLNLDYDPEDPTLYVSPDVIVVEPPRPLPGHITSYQIGPDRPVPMLVAEVLSYRTFQEGDLTYKPTLYGNLGVAKYILIDVPGDFLPQRLLRKRCQADGTWLDEQEDDGGISSTLGFRVILDADGQIRVIDSKTGKRYARPEEAQAEADERAATARALRKAERAARAAEKRVQTLEAELERLRRSKRKRKKA